MTDNLETRIDKLEAQVHILSLKTTISSLKSGGLHPMLEDIQKDLLKHFFPKITGKNMMILNSVQWPEHLDETVKDLVNSLTGLKNALSRNNTDQAKNLAKQTHDKFHAFEGEFYTWLEGQDIR